jgi:hypothetical protein
VLWLSLRQFRVQALVVGAMVLALTVVVVSVGSQVLHDYHAAAGSGALIGFVDKYQTMGQWLSALVLVMPGLIGVFWGAPLVARELESGTFRLGWTQSVSRARWTQCKLGLLGLSGMVVAGVCSLLVTWWSSPLDLALGAGPFATFDTRGIVPVAYAAFAFALGVAAGAVIRRTVAAMAATLVAFVGVRVAFAELVRSHLMAPLSARTPYTVSSPHRVQIGANLPHGAWVVSESIVDRAGHVVNGAPAEVFQNLSTAVTPGGSVTIPGVGSCPNLAPLGARGGGSGTIPDLVARCINQLHLANVVTYQPASRYWPFQIYESLIFVTLAGVVGAFTVWWVRRLN